MTTRKKRTALMFLKNSIVNQNNEIQAYVRDDHMMIGNVKYYWNSRRKLMAGSEDGAAALSVVERPMCLES